MAVAVVTVFFSLVHARLVSFGFVPFALALAFTLAFTRRGVVHRLCGEKKFWENFFALLRSELSPPDKNGIQLLRSPGHSYTILCDHKHYSTSRSTTAEDDLIVIIFGGRTSTLCFI